MVDDKINCMIKSKEYDFDYWDGDRRYGYGGYKYDGRWKVVAQDLINIYKLQDGCKILDVGCGDGKISKAIIEKFNCKVIGVDISKQARELAKK